MKMRKADNNGFSLAEVLIVVAIISILTGVFTISISLVYSRDTEKCVKLIDSALETARMGSLSREGSFFVSVDGNNNKLKVESSIDGVVEETELPKRVKLEITAEGDGASITGTELLVEFDKAKGAVKTFRLDGSALAKTSSYTVAITAQSNGDGKKASVMLVRMTGKHYLDY